MLLVSLHNKMDQPHIYTFTSPLPFGLLRPGHHSAVQYILISYLFHTQYPQCVRIHLCLPVSPISPSPCLLAQSLSHVRLFQTKECRPPPQPGRSEERILCWNSQKKCSQVSPLLSVQWDPFQSSDLENYKTTNLCCSGLPHL